MTCCAMRSGRRMRGTATTLHRRGRIAGGKQIDGVVDDPENGGLKSGPCLIAGFHALSCTSPSYYNPYRGVNKNTLSVDMVRLSLTFKGDRGEWLSRKGAQLTDCDEMSAWTA